MAQIEVGDQPQGPVALCSGKERQEVHTKWWKQPTKLHNITAPWQVHIKWWNPSTKLHSTTPPRQVHTKWWNPPTKLHSTTPL